MTMTPQQSWQRVTELFEQALERAPDERLEFLKAACSGDTALLREVESLLFEHEAEASFMEHPAAEVVAKEVVSDEGHLTIGEQLRHYQIAALLGRGGMGEVYLAQDMTLGRQVALKLLPASFTEDASRLRRFEQEARATSALNHPNIVTVHEIGHEESAHFIVTEFVDGQTLSRHMREARLPLDEVLDIAMQTAAALAAAHEAGIVHRDIKPDNIMLRRDHLVKVLDFGLVKLTSEANVQAPVDSQAPTRAQLKTTPGLILGTVNYMSPEQARGQQVDARTDIFSLGVVLYEMLTGKQPFQGDTMTDVLANILHREPPALSEFRADTPAALEHIVTKSLCKSKEGRYSTARELLADLKNLQKRRELAAELESSAQTEKNAAAETRISQAGTRETLLRKLKARRTLAIVGLLGLLLLAGVAVGRWFYGTGVSPIQSIAVMPFVNASGNTDVEYLSDGMTESLINSLSQLPGLNVKARSTVFRYKGKEVEPRQVGKELNVQAVLNGRVVQRSDQLTLSLELVDVRTENVILSEQYNRKQADLVSLQSEIALDVSNKLRARLSSAEERKLAKKPTENAEAYQAYLKGRYYWYKYPAPGFEKSREYFQQAIDLDPSYALGYVGVAYYYGFASANGILPPNENWPKAEAASNKALALDDTLVDTYNGLAAVKLYYYRDWTAAERYFRRGIELNPNHAEIHHHYSVYLVLSGRNEEAHAEIQRAVELDPFVLRYNWNFARLFYFTRQYDRAIDQLRKTLELEPNYAAAHEWLGYAYEQKGMQKEAIAEWAKALSLSKEEEQASTLERAYAASGFETAVRALAQKKLERLDGRASRGEYVPAAEYVTTYMRLGDKEQAFAWLAKAVEERNRLVLDINVNPTFDGLRNDPRFKDLMRRGGLPG